MDYDNVGTEGHSPNVRPMEIIWIVLAFFLLIAYLETTDVSHKVIEEKRTQIEGCIAQFEAGQHHRNPQFQCAPMVEAPVTAMTRPIQ